ncbi:MAG: hypothetical protein IT383_03305 [Deltaproteobacteria bacterium]|nr:hypothetical protein [Deltaproteobacteria bacterium]
MPRCPRAHRALLSLLPLVGAMTAAPAALAGFDAATGKVVLADAAWSLPFDAPSELDGATIQGYDSEGEVLDLSAVHDRMLDDAERAIEGSGLIRLGGEVSYLSLGLPAPDANAAIDALRERRVRVSFWQRPRGTRVGATLSWFTGGIDNPDATFLASMTLQPTGNVTDDGWEEWTSGAFDFAWGGVFAPGFITFTDEQVAVYYGGGSWDVAAQADVDGLAIVDLGPAAVTPASCTLPSERADCGDDGVCHLGVCVDAAVRLGAPLEDPQLRANYVDRRIFEVERFEGGRAPRTRTGLVADALAPLKGSARATEFWPAFTAAYQLLVDGHASAPMVSYPSYANGGVCVHAGEADLLADVAPEERLVPLVFSADDNELGALLAPGDALVRIDGQPVHDWAAAAARLISHPGDPAGRDVVIAPQIFNAALDAGAVVTFARCSGGAPCASADVEELVIDLAALTGERLLDGGTAPLLSYSAAATCDFRFRRPVEAPNVKDYAFAGAADEGGVRSLLINGVPDRYMEGGDTWFDRVTDALGDEPSLVLFDERSGAGGSIDAVDLIAAMLLAEGDSYAMDFLPSFEGAEDDGVPRAAVVACSSDPNAYSCGNGFRYRVGDGGGPMASAASAKLAVLIADDVSGNDYVTRLLKERSAGATRIFGDGATWGAFGVIWGMAAHVGEMSGGSLQVQDTIFVDASDEPLSGEQRFETSTGIRPDQVVRQKQSDAVVGKDTVLEAARAWLLEVQP